MEVEIWLDTTQADPGDHHLIEKKLLDWHREGAEIRYDKVCFGGLAVLDESDRFRVNLGEAEPVGAIRDLHARLYRHGVKIFVHFMP